jgi:tryptophan synthase alpha chain
MSRIPRRFEQLRGQGRQALIPYITCGDPEPDATVPLMQRLVSAGADIIEIGMPFSDPMADGPTIQRACERALAHDTGIRDIFGMVRDFRRHDDDTPVVLMGYLNPIEQMGYATFAREAAACGADAVLTVDLPPEEGHALVEALTDYDIDPIWLVAPTTRQERIEAICSVARGFVYYVSVKGVTGAENLDLDDVAAHVQAIGRTTQLPVGVGFGIRDAETAARIAGVADAAVVGSAIVQCIADNLEDSGRRETAVAELVAGMRRAMDQAHHQPHEAS